MTKHIWLNGALQPLAQPALSVFDHGFTVGDGAFETLKIVDGVPFAIDRHLARLHTSLAGLMMAPVDESLIRRGIHELLDANEHMTMGRLRITVTSGAGPLGSDRSTSEHTITIAQAEQKAWPETASVAVVPWPRNEHSPLAGLKTTSYAENVVALEVAHRAGSAEALFADTQGRMCEGTGSNVFAVIDGMLHTPSADTGLLEGVTRNLLLEWCAAEGITCHVRDLPLDAYFFASEMFITSSTRDVQPVTELKVVGVAGNQLHSQTFEVGKITKMCQSLFSTNSQQNVNP